MKHFIGVDVSKHQLDVDWLNKPVCFDNNQHGISKLIKKLKELNEALVLVICEASGGYEQKMVKACHQANLPIHVAHANKIRNFAKSKGLKAKTDKLDSRVLSEYAKALQPKPDTLMLGKNALKIRELLKRREQLQKDRKREKCRLDKNDDKNILDSINEHIDWLDDSIKKIDSQLAELQKENDISDDYTLLTSIPGIGELSAYQIISFLPEIGKVSNKAIASLTGVAPFNHDSGNYQGKRYIQGGRKNLRHSLYMAALTSTRYNPELKIFYQRLIEAGKSAKVAIIAVMRKLLSVVNSVMKRRTNWESNYKKIGVFC
jgi:transposase